MATGDQSDITARLRSYLPKKWFGDFATAPIISALVSGIASTFATIYLLIQFFIAQTRLQTSSGGWVDLWAYDFFGNALPRLVNETDAAYVLRIQAALFQPKVTRAAMITALTNATGRAPNIFEPMRPADTGGYGVACWYGQGGITPPPSPLPSFGCGYGSLLLPFQCFVTAFRQKGSGIPNVAGYGVSTAGYATPSQGDYASLSQIIGGLSDAGIYSLISSIQPVATEIWVRLSN